MRAYLANLWDKIKYLLISRKFWALAAALIGVGAGLSAGEITTWQAIQAGVAALSVYATSVAVEDGLSASHGTTITAAAPAKVTATVETEAVPPAA